jgi:hypothetical protein
MIDGRFIGKRRKVDKRGREEGRPSLLPSYFSTIASTGHTSEQLPHSVHFSPLIT